MDALPNFESMFADSSSNEPEATVLGTSRQDRPIPGYRFGSGRVRVSLLGGCHADEPVGPRLLDRVVRWLGAREPSHPALTAFEWWVVPHINPDGARRNESWQSPEPRLEEGYDPATYLGGVVRELPGDDIEFGFPRSEEDRGGRPEPRAVFDWWSTAEGPFHLHLTLHGMAFAAGPWFLIEPEWIDRTTELRRRCRDAVSMLGYVLHDVERHGEKGFHRIERGFCTRPDSGAMARHFRARDENEMAERFRPSSMEAIRRLGGDPLTLVSEMPLFLLPGVGEALGPPDPEAVRWRNRIEGWRQRSDSATVANEILESGLAPMPVGDQMRLQWALVRAGVSELLASNPL